MNRLSVQAFRNVRAIHSHANLLGPSTRQLTISVRPIERTDSSHGNARPLPAVDNLRTNRSDESTKLAEIVANLRMVALDYGHLQSTLQLFRQEKIPLNLICQLSQYYPQLLTYPTLAWRKAFAILHKNGFKRTTYLSVISAYPGLMEGDEKQLLRMIWMLQAHKVPSNSHHHILTSNPAILRSSADNLNEQIAFVKSMFYRRATNRIMLRNPAILTQDQARLAENHNYVTFVMACKTPDIVLSSVFKYDLRHIKTRHVFLQRAGLYQRPNKHGVTTIRNPSLSRIIDTSDREFALHVAKMSLDEYEVFKGLYARELDEEALGEDEEEDDDDDWEEENSSAQAPGEKREEHVKLEKEDEVTRVDRG